MKCKNCGVSVTKNTLHRTNPKGQSGAGWMCIDCIGKKEPELAKNIKQDNYEVINAIEKGNKSKWSKGFNAGFAAACAIAIRSHGCDSIIEDVLNCNFMDEAAMRRHGIDEYDIEILKPIIKEIKRKSIF